MPMLLRILPSLLRTQSIFKYIHHGYHTPKDFSSAHRFRFCQFSTMASVTATPFKLALVQLAVGANKDTNLTNAGDLVLEAAEKGADVVVLPECFNSPYGTAYFPEYAEPIPGGISVKALSTMAKDANVYLIDSI